MSERTRESWKIEATLWEAEVAEFGRPIAAEHDHHEVRDWLNDAFAAGEERGKKAGLEMAAKWHDGEAERARAEMRKIEDACMEQEADAANSDSWHDLRRQAQSDEGAASALRALALTPTAQEKKR